MTSQPSLPEELPATADGGDTRRQGFWNIVGALSMVAIGLLALGLFAATGLAVTLECSSRFPDTDLCPGQPTGWMLIIATGAAVALPAVVGFVMAARSSRRRATFVMLVTGAAMFFAASLVELWATGTWN